MEEHLAEWFFTLHALITIQSTLYPCKCCVAISFFCFNEQAAQPQIPFTAIVPTEKMEQKLLLGCLLGCLCVTVTKCGPILQCNCLTGTFLSFLHSTCCCNYANFPNVGGITALFILSYSWTSLRTFPVVPTLEQATPLNKHDFE